MLYINRADTVLSTTGVVTAAGTLLNVNTNRRTIVIQNLNGTDPLYVKFGDGASTSSFTFILKPGAAPDDGQGGIMAEDTLSYTGIITIAGTSIRCVATEF